MITYPVTSSENLLGLCRELGTLLQSPAPNQFHLRVADGKALRVLSERLRALGFYLCTLVGTDERSLADSCFKLTYLFSHPSDDLFLFIENPISRAQEESAVEPASWSRAPTMYPSLYDDFRAVDPFERELVDMMGLYPHPNERPRRVTPGSWLHDCYPRNLCPLRRDRTTELIKANVELHRRRGNVDDVMPSDGEWILPVGPVHAGVIEPGLFLFRLSGEIIEDVSIRLGYTHKGVERLFQTEYTLEEGWRLAERISGDSSFAHSLAYCRAVEALANACPPPRAELLRGLFLEMERIANHVGDCAALAHDVAHEVGYSELSYLREQLLQFNFQVTGHRLLRGVNRPGGVVLPRPLDNADVLRLKGFVAGLRDSFTEMAQYLSHSAAFRDRMQWIGILTRKQADALGATGMVARASGIRRDFRLQHPTGIYTDAHVRKLVERGLPPEGDAIESLEATAGDTLARFLVRLREVDSSAGVIGHILSQFDGSKIVSFLTPVDLRGAPNFGFGLGCVEGWRGSIVYWLMKDKFQRIFRCKVCDPSLLNWPALKAAIDPHELDDEYVRRYTPPSSGAETIVADFPVINKSFNLSYSGNDL